MDEKWFGFRIRFETFGRLEGIKDNSGYGVEDLRVLGSYDLLFGSDETPATQHCLRGASRFFVQAFAKKVSQMRTPRVHEGWTEREGKPSVQMVRGTVQGKDSVTLGKSEDLNIRSGITKII